MIHNLEELYNRIIDYHETIAWNADFERNRNHNFQYAALFEEALAEHKDIYNYAMKNLDRKKAPSSINWNWLAEKYKDYEQGEILQSEWMQIAEKALTTLMEENTEVLQRLKENRPAPKWD